MKTGLSNRKTIMYLLIFDPTCGRQALPKSLSKPKSSFGYFLLKGERNRKGVFERDFEECKVESFTTFISSTYLNQSNRTKNYINKQNISKMN